MKRVQREGMHILGKEIKLTCFRSIHLLLQKKVKSAYAIMPIEMGSSMRTIACVVLLVTGPDPACFASFSDSTEKLASAVVMPPIVIAICIQDKKVLSFAEGNTRAGCALVFCTIEALFQPQKVDKTVGRTAVCSATVTMRSSPK